MSLFLQDALEIISPRANFEGRQGEGSSEFPWVLSLSIIPAALSIEQHSLGPRAEKAFILKCI